LHIAEQLQTWCEVSVPDSKVRGEWENFEYLVYPVIVICPSSVAGSLDRGGNTSRHEYDKLRLFDFAS
jgi:hypothetical protein